MYGWNIEKVTGGFILTHSEPNYSNGLSVGGPPSHIRYVFATAKELLDFLAEKLK